MQSDNTMSMQMNKTIDKLMQIDNQSLILGGCITFLKVKFYCNMLIVVLLYSQEIFSKGTKCPNRKRERQNTAPLIDYVLVIPQNPFQSFFSDI